MENLLVITFHKKMDMILCTYCGKTSPSCGWQGLCNRQCYYGLCELIEAYDHTNVLDQRVIEYFLFHPKTSHSFVCNRDKMFNTCG